MPIPRALSIYASPRESTSLQKLWKMAAVYGEGQSATSRALVEHQNKISSIRIFTPHSDVHPFKIYQLPDALRQINGITLNATKDWRTFRVRAGVILTTDARGVLPDKTDKVGFPYDEIYLNQVSGSSIGPVQEIVVPDATAVFYFWIEVTISGSTMTAVVRWHTDPTQTSYTDASNPSCNWTSTNAWTGFPTPDGNHIIIGFVNTSTITKVAIVRQFLTTDVLNFAGVECPLG